MNIKVSEEDIISKMEEPSGECAICNLEIIIDKNIDPRAKQRLVIHAVIENYCRSWMHEKVEQLEDFIMDALDQLEAI